MPMYDRGGKVLKTGKIGRVNILRQQMLLPGERLRASVNGGVRLTTLREPESVSIHARVDGFVQPLRWLWPEFVQYLKDGPSAAQTWPTVQVSPGPSAAGRTASDLGLGGNTGAQVLGVFEEAVFRIYNEWYKWPEDVDVSTWPPDGWQAVNLPHSWTRLQNKPEGEATEVMTQASGSREKFDIRALAELQERFRQSVDQDWIAEDRYVDLLRQLWGEDGSREVDQVPVRLDGAEIGVNPRNIYATDAGGLGAGMSLYQFGVNHNFGTISMPEHCIVTYVLVVRFSTVAEDELNPVATSHDRSWAEMVGEPGMLGAQRPTGVRDRNLTGGSGTTVLGYLPAGWQWRARWNVVGARIDDRGSYPLLKSLSASTAQQMRNASRVGEPFQSASLGDYLVDMDFSEMSASPVARSDLVDLYRDGRS